MRRLLVGIASIAMMLLGDSSISDVAAKTAKQCKWSSNACQASCQSYKPEAYGRCLDKCGKRYDQCMSKVVFKPSKRADPGSTNSPPKGTGNRPPTGGGVVSDPKRPPKGVGNHAPFGGGIKSNPRPSSGSGGPILRRSQGGRR